MKNMAIQEEERQSAGKYLKRSSAIRFVVLLGFVSLLADMTYEGARSITGPYMALLGASAVAVGLVAGFGELLGYALRLFSGIIADKTRRYWTLTIIGYAINLLAVPLLALAGSWELAAVLMLLERLGKSIRTPARDVMLSHATQVVGRGWGFGLHEAMDQIGALAGPLIISLVMMFKGSYTNQTELYRFNFALLAIPAVMALLVLLLARFVFPKPQLFEQPKLINPDKNIPKAFYIYLIAAGCIALGYADFPLIAFHIKKHLVVNDSWIPALYALAMGTDAIAALIFGKWYDKSGLLVLAAASLISAFFAPFAFGDNLNSAIIGMVLWGIGMGAQESVLRAAVADMVTTKKRGTAYGIFTTFYGITWFGGSAAMGFLYDWNISVLIGFSVISQLIAVPVFFYLHKTR